MTILRALATPTDGLTTQIVNGRLAVISTPLQTTPLPTTPLPTTPLTAAAITGIVGNATPGGGAVASTTIPAIDGAAAIGVSLNYARADHVHPTDYTRYPSASNPAGYQTAVQVTATLGGLADGATTSYSAGKLSVIGQTVTPAILAAVQATGRVTISGSRGSATAAVLEAMLTVLAAAGFINDATTA